jgi:hypothetical protein
MYAAMPHYAFVLERATGDLVDTMALSTTMDQELRRRNINYDSYRSTGLLAGLHVEWFEAGTFAARRASARRGRTATLAQQKHKVVIDSAELEELRRVSQRLRTGASDGECGVQPVEPRH